MIKNFDSVLQTMPSHCWESGLIFYAKLSDVLRRLGQTHGFTLNQAAGIFAALSPNCDYYGNLVSAYNLMLGYRQGLRMEAVKVRTYGANKRKAWAMAEGEDPGNLLQALKTRSFYLNLRDPSDVQSVTVDGHIYNCWMGQRQTLVGLRGLSRRSYLKIAEDVRQVAAVHGLIPCQMQSILWLAWRWQFLVGPGRQLEMWHPESLMVGLGFEPVAKAA